MRFFCVFLRCSVCVCRWSFLLGVRAVRSLLFRQILNSISRSECKNGPIKGSAAHAMRSCACAMFRHMQLPMMHPLVGHFDCGFVQGSGSADSASRDSAGTTGGKPPPLRVVTNNASVKLGHGGHVGAYVSAREKKAHARTHIGPDVEVERAQYVLVPQDALRPAKLGRRGRLERA